MNPSLQSEPAAPLSPEAPCVRPMPDAGPARRRRAHTTWGFETRVPAAHAPGHRPHAARRAPLHACREPVDAAPQRFIAGADRDTRAAVRPLVEPGRVRHAGAGFGFANETPRHALRPVPSAIGRRLVTKAGCSSCDPYPRHRPWAGAAGEYDGAFMAGQIVLRRSSAATPPGHARPTCRNFFPPAARRPFSGLRLARDL